MHPYFDGKYIRCDDLIPRMAAEFHWGVESGKLMYPSMFEHVATFVYMSHSFPSSKGSAMCPWYTVCGKMTRIWSS
jgi:hypothetical protein